MKRARVVLFSALVAALSVALPTVAAHAGGKQVVTMKSLLREMTDYATPARLPHPEYVTSQASSYDRRSKTPADAEGWFANNDFSQFIRSELHGGRREWVMMDADGPGCVTRIWWGGMMPPKERRVRFYLDGAETPAIEAPAYELLTGTLLAQHPLSIENAHGAPGAPGGMNLFLPIPYASHCKITWDDVNPNDPAAPPDGRWYNIEYRTYALGTQVETFSPQRLEQARSAMAKACRMLSNPPIPSGRRKLLLHKALSAGEEAAVDLPSGAKAVRLLEITLATDDRTHLAQAMRSTVLQLRFDDEVTAWCPVGDFFGSGEGLNPLQSWRRTVTRDGVLTCRWVMPYRKSARLTLMNLGDARVTATMRAAVTGWKWDDRSLYFHANWRAESGIKTRPLSDWNYLTATGAGIYVGDTLCVYNPVSDWWGEGDEKIRVDGESFPSHFGTGSEDCYGYSYGDTTLFQGPFSNQVRCDGPGNKGVTVVTRTRCLDAIPFTSSLQFDMEIWHWADCRVDYAVATYWYARPGATHNRPPQPEEARASVHDTAGLAPRR